MNGNSGPIPNRPFRRAAGVVRAFGAVLALALAGLPAARAEFPDKPVHIVVGFGPGTGSDIQARALSEAFARELKTTVVVDNKPGAAGMLAAAHVAGSPPDGYSVIFGTTTLIVTLPLLSPKSAKYDSVQDFVPIGGMGKSAFVVVVANKPGAPATLKELVARMKASSLSFGSIGNGSFGHLGSLRLMQLAGVPGAVHVPYKSSPQELQDLVAGNLAFVTDSTVATLPLIRNGLLTPLAVTSSARLASMPEVPTVGEVLGTPFEHTVWTGLLAPRGTPGAIVQKLSAALAAALNDKDVRDRFATMQLVPFELDAAAFGAHIRGEVPAWRAFLDKSGIKLEE